MTLRTLSIGGAVLGTFLAVSGAAHASMVLDTGTPTSNTGAPVTMLSTTQWVAAEFNLSAGATVTNVAAYLTLGSGNVGDTINVDIYSNASFLNSRTLSPVSATTDTFTSNGWNATTLSKPFTSSAGGLYWVALEVGSTSQTKGLSLPGAGISTTSGTAPAQAFALYGTNHQFAASSLAPFGIQVTATAAPVPLPASAWLLLSGVGGLGALVRKRRATVPAA